MPTIEIDFESYKELVRRRPSETVSEADVIRDLLFGKSKEIAPTPKHVWVRAWISGWEPSFATAFAMERSPKQKSLIRV